MSEMSLTIAETIKSIDFISAKYDEVLNMMKS